MHDIERAKYLIDKLKQNYGFIEISFVIKIKKEFYIIDTSYAHKNISMTFGVIKEWSENQKAKLFKIALENNQVTYILKDGDVKKFYSEICKDDNSEEAKNIKDIINKEK